MQTNWNENDFNMNPRRQKPTWLYAVVLFMLTVLLVALHVAGV